MSTATSGAQVSVDGITARPAYDFEPPAEFFATDTTPSGDNVFDVRDFGATADPNVDNRPMIQAAIDAAHEAGGGIVYIPPGTYGIAGQEDGAGGLNVLGNVFVKGAGMGETVLRLVDGSDQDITGLVRSPWGEETTNWGISDFTIDGNQHNTTGQVDGFFTGPQPGSTISDQDVYVSRIEIHDVSRYGFDPHELTERLTIEDSVAHNNGVDGFVLDMVVDSVITGNLSYDNGRHGFNIVTTSEDLLLQDNISRDNGGAGFVIQRGSEDIESPSNIVISGGSSSGNGREGVLVQMSDDVVITGVDIHDNGMSGIKLYGSSNVTVEGNNVHDNSQSGHDAYSEVLITAYEDSVYGHTYDASNNLITDNTIASSGDVRSRYGIEEREGSTANNEIGDNSYSGLARGPLSLNGLGSYVSMHGTDSSETITGSATQDHVVAGDGDDVVSGKDGNDFLEGGLGNDDMLGGKGNDIMLGGEGADTLNGNSGNDIIDGGAGDDNLDGSKGNDTLDGGSGNDILHGGSGSDVLIGNFGDDFYDGDSGFDTLDYSGTSIGLDINASTKTVTGLGVHTFDSIERIIGSSGDDTFRGSDGVNIMIGGDGNDSFRSAGGADIMTGGEGNDSYSWQVRDVVSSSGHRGVDTITDFAAGDVLNLADLVAKTTFSDRDEVVRVTDTGDGLMVAAMIDGAFQDVVLLAGVHRDGSGATFVDDAILVF